MNHKLWLGLLLALPGAFVGVVAALLVRGWLRRRAVWQQRLALLYLRTLTAMAGGQCRLYGFRFIDRPGARLALAEALAVMNRTWLDGDPALLRSVMRGYDLEELLLRRLRLPWMRPRALRLLAHLPVSRQTAQRLERMPRPRHREVRFALLRARINASPVQGIDWLRAHRDPLSPLECRELMTMLLRGSLPIAYGPLLMAPEENLRRLGLCLVRHFGIEQAVGRVRALTADAGVGREALEVLCDLHHPIPEFASAPLTPRERRILLHRAAAEGYALQGLGEGLSREEQQAFKRLAACYTIAQRWA